jgi:glucokinase-like ROK family protein
VAQTFTVTASAMRAINRSAILDTIRRQGPISRTAIAHQLGLSLPTVMRLVDGLVQEGFVRPLENKEWSGGRRRSLVEFNTQGHVVLGIDLGGTKMYGAVADLGGHVLDEVNIGPHGTSGEESYQRLLALIDRLLASPSFEGRQVRGIGLGVPGITLHQEGIVQWAYTLQWRDLPLKARLEERYRLPCTVDNDVNLAALGELWYGAGQQASNMILVAIGTGIGAGIIIDGALYRGSHEASGEIGGMVPGREFLGKDYRDFGALESVASGTGIAQRARAAGPVVVPAPGSVPVGTEEVFEAARQGQPWAIAILKETVDFLAIAIANLTATLDPEVIVLGGGVARSADLLIDPILRRLEGTIPTLPRLVLSELGPRATVMGAIANVLHTTTETYVVRRLS